MSRTQALGTAKEMMFLDSTASCDETQSTVTVVLTATPAPQCFMTDNSAAERAALEATWPEATRLLWHFHVAQAEWRWLQASRNQVSQDERRQLMKAFQKARLLTALDKCIQMACCNYAMFFF
ncbi:hypothetical protein HPB48_019512 [Haemaphysalis longicornis]|uniref:Uncharacterized protein n=1 Tax=Haemaphysalis longicornis TaxID=44386 RepID=A0A9J6FWW1_HAELO|nr:hypothetical protein HPB48_019512 [Haemaphysalis longicornis]